MCPCWKACVLTSTPSLLSDVCERRPCGPGGRPECLPPPGNACLAQVGWEALLGAPATSRPPTPVCLSRPVLAGCIGEGPWAVPGPAQALTRGPDGNSHLCPRVFSSCQPCCSAVSRSVCSVLPVIQEAPAASLHSYLSDLETLLTGTSPLPFSVVSRAA